MCVHVCTEVIGDIIGDVRCLLPTLSAYLLLETVSLTDQLSRQTDLGALFFFCLSPHHQCSVDRLCVRCLNTYDPMEARR
jgi:hypothetical protein